MEWILKRIEQSDNYFGYNDFLSYPKDLNKLKALGIIEHEGNLDEIECSICFENHTTQIRHKNNELFIICENGHGRKDIDQEVLMLYKFNINRFLLQFAKQIPNIQTDIKEVIPNKLWKLGSLIYDDNKLEIFYTINIAKQKDKIISITKNLKHILLFNNSNSQTQLPNTIYNLPILNCIKGITTKEITLDKRHLNEFLIKNLRKVIFKEDKLYVHGQKIVHIDYHTSNYYFLEILWKNFDKPVSHKKIFEYVQKKMKKEYNDTAQLFCNRRKESIRKKSINIQLVENILTSCTTKNGLAAIRLSPPIDNERIE